MSEPIKYDPPEFVANGRRYVQVPWTKCGDCALNGRVFCDGAPCVPSVRKDYKNVMFRKEETP